MFIVKIISLIFGLIFQSNKLFVKFSTLIIVLIISILISCLNFIPYRMESSYSIQNHLHYFPYWFICIFIFISYIENKKKLTHQLTEGITLLQSISIIYWAIDYHIYSNDDLFLNSILFIGFIFCAFSFYNAFTHHILSRTTRLILSIWSSLIMLIFGLEFIIKTLIFSSETNQFIITLKFFLLGVSSLFILENAMLLFAFYKASPKETTELKKEHIDRFSNRQVNRKLSLFSLIYSTIIFSFNYRFSIVDKSISIWFVFISTPILLKYFSNKYVKS